MLKKIDAILWRKCNPATLASLQGDSPGQYDVRLTSKDYLNFFKGLTKVEPTNLGGFTISVPLEAYDGTNPVPQQTLNVRYMGDQSHRKDWNIPSQRPETAYPLWRPGVGPPKIGPVGANEYLVIARDHENHFHARWISHSTFQNLPQVMKTKMQSTDAGWSLL